MLCPQLYIACILAHGCSLKLTPAEKCLLIYRSDQAKIAQCCWYTYAFFGKCCATIEWRILWQGRCTRRCLWLCL